MNERKIRISDQEYISVFLNEGKIGICTWRFHEKDEHGTWFMPSYNRDPLSIENAEKIANAILELVKESSSLVEKFKASLS